MLVFWSHTPPLNTEDPSPPSSLSVPVKPSSAEDVQDLVSASPSRIPTLATVQQVKYQCPLLSDLGVPVDVWLPVPPPIAGSAPNHLGLPRTCTYTHTQSLQPTASDHVATHKHTQTETLLIWQQLLGFFGHSSQQITSPTPACHIPSLSCSASFSRLLLGNYSAEPSHRRDMERSVSVSLATHTQLSLSLTSAVLDNTHNYA